MLLIKKKKVCITLNYTPYMLGYEPMTLISTLSYGGGGAF